MRHLLSRFAFLRQRITRAPLSARTYFPLPQRLQDPSVLTSLRSVSTRYQVRWNTQEACVEEEEESFPPGESQSPMAADAGQATIGRFADLPNLHPTIKKCLSKDFGYDTMTPVQNAVLPKMPVETDLLVKAKTGTGKTLAFLLPTINALMENPRRKVLILSPTRELAKQIFDEASKLLKVCQMHGLCAVGGDAKVTQLYSLDRSIPRMVVGTPGRTMDLYDSHPNMKDFVESASALVLDEADRMLEVGSKEDILEIASRMPTPESGRQTFLYSATFPKNVNRLIDEILVPNNLTQIDARSSEDDEGDMLKRIDQAYITDDAENLPAVLYRILEANRDRKVIVFFPTTKMTNLYANILDLLGFKTVEIHGGLRQAQRTRSSETFRRWTSGVMVTSDVSARGVDYPNVHLVIQFGIPTTRDRYVHRIGRTGRAGKDGKSLLLLCKNELPFVTDALKHSACLPDATNSYASWVERDGEDRMNQIKNRISILGQSGRVRHSQMLDAHSSLMGYYQQVGPSIDDLEELVTKEFHAHFQSLGMRMIPTTIGPSMMSAIRLHKKRLFNELQQQNQQRRKSDRMTMRGPKNLGFGWHVDNGGRDRESKWSSYGHRSGGHGGPRRMRRNRDSKTFSARGQSPWDNDPSFDSDRFGAERHIRRASR